MIDHIKVNIDFNEFENDNLFSLLVNHKELGFPEPVNTFTGECQTNEFGEQLPFNKRPTLKSKYKGLRFLLKSNYNGKYSRFIIDGSLHKYLNYIRFNKPVNYIDCRYSELQDGISKFLGKFQINSKKASVNNFEYGYNLNVKINPSELLKQIVHIQGCNNERGNINYNKKIKVGKKIVFDFAQYQIKLYDKAAESSLTSNVLRFEIVIKSLQFLIRLGLDNNSLNEIIKKDTMKLCHKILTQKFKKILFVDLEKLNEIEIPINDRAFIMEYSNDKNLILLKRKDYPKYQRCLQKYRKLINNYELNSIQKALNNQIEYKFEQFINF